jgi:hypothetical protein
MTLIVRSCLDVVICYDQGLIENRGRKQPASVLKAWRPETRQIATSCKTERSIAHKEIAELQRIGPGQSCTWAPFGESNTLRVQLADSTFRKHARFLNRCPDSNGI